MAQSVNHEARAFLAWPVLIDCAIRGSTITYQELGRQIGGVHQRAIGHTLGPIQSYCLDTGIPPLTVLVIQKTAGRPGGGFIAADDFAEATREVFAFQEWRTLPNPFTYAADSVTSQESLADELLERPGDAADVYTRVRVRGIAQQVFRQHFLRHTRIPARSAG